MEIVTMRWARMHLSRLVARAARGESFVIARAGRLLVKVVAVRPTVVPAQRRVGFLAGKLAVPEDFDRLGQEQVEALFGRSNGDCSPILDGQETSPRRA